MPVDKRRTDKKDLWDKLSSIGPLFIALAVSAIGGWFNFQQASLEKANHRQELFTSLLAQRERADSNLRATMFNTLFEAYFGGKFSSKTAKRPADSKGNEQFNPNAIRSQIMFLNLLSRNFDTIDIKPLFEEVDRQLTVLINDKRAGDDSKDAFVLRQKLRRVGKSLALNQAKNLASLQQTHTEKVFIKKCGSEPAEFHIIGKTQVQSKIIDVTDILDGKVRVVLDTSDSASDNGVPPSFTVSFYDMPYIDNAHLSSNVRLSIVLEQYISPRRFKPFLNQIVDHGIADTVRRSLENGRDSNCDQAVIRLIQFPEGYMGLRDRPYLEEVYRRILHAQSEKGGKI
ncbi:hypothetical protein MNBD_DELTA03-1111 [hydrothermal vent metagenome]|uniref:Uncharacterized protein n=1 Tax=hydrothermal vent metagenome TaxID=652676 RepID=A0A3B0VPU2_9ZZZZ